jgi:hypothetical protein
MKQTLAWTLVLLPLAVGAQQLNLKLGAWEMTHKSATLPRPIVEKECLTKADLAQLATGPDKDDETECKYVKPPVVTGNKWSGDKVCGDGRKVHAEVVAETPERVKGTIVAAGPGGGGQSMVVETNGRWLGASCAGIK